MRFDLSVFSGALDDLRNRPRNNIPALDALRTAAIVLVFCTHFAGHFHPAPFVARLPFNLYGWSGVDLFFVLSGTLIGTQLWNELKRTGRIEIGTFLLRRGLRIWPLYFAFAFFVLAQLLVSGRPIHKLWADFTFLSNYFEGGIAGGWSLSIEEQFYIAAPVTLFALSRFLKPKDLWPAVASMMGLLVVSRVLSIWALGITPRDQYRLGNGIHTHADGLVIGLLIAYCSIFRSELLRSRRFRTMASVVALIVAAVLYWWKAIVFNYAALALIYGAAAFYLMGLNTPPAILRWHGFYIISRLSFGMYLNHFGLLSRLRPALGWIRDRGGEPGYWLVFVISLSASIAIAALTFQLVEWPFLVIRSRWLKRRAAQRLSGAVAAVGSAS